MDRSRTVRTRPRGLRSTAATTEPREAGHSDPPGLCLTLDSTALLFQLRRLWALAQRLGDRLFLESLEHVVTITVRQQR